MLEQKQDSVSQMQRYSYTAATQLVSDLCVDKLLGDDSTVSMKVEALQAVQLRKWEL